MVKEPKVARVTCVLKEWARVASEPANCAVTVPMAYPGMSWWRDGQRFCSESCYIAGRHLRPASPPTAPPLEPPR